MSDQQPEHGSETPADYQGITPPSADGADDVSVAVADVTETAPVADVTETAAITAPESAAVAAPESAAVTAPVSSDEGSAFLAELAKAMQTTAATERARVSEDTDRRREAHVAEIHARRDAEIERMRELADQDSRAVDAWAERERQRVQQERQRRIQDLQADLERSLAEHRAKIDRETDGVEAAVAAYRTEVDEYFAALDRETDPVALAQRAGRRPVFPDLNAIGPDGAKSTSIGDAAPPVEPSPIIGVMDRERPTKLAHAWSQWNASIKAADEQTAASATPTDEAAGAATEEAVDGFSESEPVGVASAAEGETPANATVHQAQGSGPMSWLRRGGDHNGG